MKKKLFFKLILQNKSPLKYSLAAFNCTFQIHKLNEIISNAQLTLYP